ncbi:UDP-N-acetylglucosamine 2-epimerase (non-hydrolyzing) [Candidatus Micrarchaeota archaeon]|nr:UDP-N-acetylglucosamine 2-epimerase (non-hydrolyzing) [Candidatus Micrarchaeota archaeon]
MITIVLGTRPEIVKLAPVVWELERRKAEYALVHSRQHYDFNLSKVFFEEFALRAPDAFLDAGSETDAKQTAKMMVEFEALLLQNSNWQKVVVEGDTNTVLAASIVAKKQKRLLAHVEAGARSFEKTMPEEINRIVCDHLSDMLFAPTKICLKHLRDENIPESRIVLSGNTQFETLEFALGKAKAPFNTPSKFVLATVHRQENTTPEKLKQLVKLFASIKEEIVFLAHPRTRKALEQSKLDGELKKLGHVHLHEPVGFFETAYLLDKCKYVVTDSGGLQKEAAFIGKPVLIPRTATEWPEIVESRHAELIGLDGKSAGKAKAFLESFSPGKIEEVESKPSKIIVDSLLQ